ncbi:hypothetical protein KIL84_022441 [Mauremys mutica]|uniref:Uncharacterized protein n=1 Tax=Mauremys mutica TaxID=74926 RepID=A0A9D3XAC9_9SAUR|nr:hypothetical protein KIL84_022441 [Mauremys mutica]
MPQSLGGHPERLEQVCKPPTLPFNAQTQGADPCTSPARQTSPSAPGMVPSAWRDSAVYESNCTCSLELGPSLGFPEFREELPPVTVLLWPPSQAAGGGTRSQTRDRDQRAGRDAPVLRRDRASLAAPVALSSLGDSAGDTAGAPEPEAGRRYATPKPWLRPVPSATDKEPAVPAWLSREPTPQGVARSNPKFPIQPRGAEEPQVPGCLLGC